LLGEKVFVALRTKLFYNTGFSTYFWILSNRESAGAARIKVILLDGPRDQWEKMRKSLGDKRKQIGRRTRSSTFTKAVCKRFAVAYEC